MGGTKHLSSIVEPLLSELVDKGITLSLGVQSNGLLFDRSMATSSEDME